MRIMRTLALPTALLLAGCAAGLDLASAPTAGPTNPTIVAGPPGGASPGAGPGQTIVAGPPGGSGSPGTSTPAAPASGEPYDPREGGFEIGLAEWAVTLEAAAIRPGPVTFVIHNGGTRAHGMEIEDDSRDSSGKGGGDGFKTEGETLRPGSSERMTLDLAPGVYKVECLVDGHDDLGMEILLEVRADAPLVTPAPAAPDAVAIKSVQFQPAELSVEPGTKVTWTNQDPMPHTVTADAGASFDSGILDDGQSFSWTFASSGTVTYFCNVHPDMRGTITVS